jgi:hypothetical protein
LFRRKRELATELRRDSTWTLDRILQDRPATAIYRLSAAAALLELVHQLGGMPALKLALNPPRQREGPDLVGGAARALNVSRSETESAWRKNVLDARQLMRSTRMRQRRNRNVRPRAWSPALERLSV